ncbi:MAG: hypothetical protein COW66_13090 [Flavobacteriaceae bacterium CG18_big_fil_WC_8_21_14_2_50_34_36]|nr:hypothetical protein [Flavobacteriia bacterium]NCT18041.1 hypothetical protein [Flavobacteriia bacterium]PIQ17202.1 MAG: hypothetical protein COW66_13090 [Flavobacteriaceae bacterium CG18_big_fil_WC_8_21_14_2_50_34_36]PJC08204.1 MAG: hypothetical protein CO068_02145 [Flavobacteriaceae bacterium CG_4_9_14_0_8_um_filter_34_30]
MKRVIEKTVNLDLVGVNGNAFMIMGVFRKEAKKEGWSQDEIDAVLKEAKSGDYNHLLATIKNHCAPKDEDNEN